jgi:hypothetical protein
LTVYVISRYQLFQIDLIKQLWGEYFLSLHSTSKAKIRLRICNPHLVGILVVQQAHRLLSNPGVASKTLACFYARAALNWFRIKLTNLRRHSP